MSKMQEDVYACRTDWVPVCGEGFQLTSNLQGTGKN